jgi:hypothetical protein
MLKAALILFITIIFSANVYSQYAPEGKSFGFGIKLGEPTGATLKFWTVSPNAFVIDVGASSFGSPRIGVDYLWHFNAFNSRMVNLYAGPGAALGFGKGRGFWKKYDRDVNEIGVGIRGVFGVNFVPERTPLEIFLELGVLMGLVPGFSSHVDVGLGIRFYP